MLPIPKNDNVVRYHNGLVKRSLPKGTGYKKANKNYLWKPKKARRGACEEFTGVKLVSWLIEQGKVQEAARLLGKIKAGEVKA